MAISFDGQVALVTGAGRGIGRAYALELASRGARVVVNDLGSDLRGSGADPGPAQAVVDEITARDGRAVANFESVASYEGGAAMVKTALETWGRLDIVICNAGIIRKMPFLDLSEDQWDRIHAVHVKGAYNVMHAAWPIFQHQRYGRVVLTSSAGGIWGTAGHADYGAAKAAMIGLMNVLKQEGEPYNIAVNVVAPGAGTRMTADLYPWERVEPLKPEFVAPAVVYLVSRDCTDSGLIISAAGGRYSRMVIVGGHGVDAGREEVKDADWIAAHWREITSLEGAEPRWNSATTLAEHHAEQARTVP
jgi:NAD(P)-dependent dehydrogenase (short-subunit alcohol dehydrogenase family)